MSSTSRSPWLIRTKRYFPVRAVDAFDERANTWRAVHGATADAVVDQNTAGAAATISLNALASGDRQVSRQVKVAFVTGAPTLGTVSTPVGGAAELEISIDFAAALGIEPLDGEPDQQQRAFADLLEMVHAYAARAADVDDWAAIGGALEIWDGLESIRRRALLELLDRAGSGRRRCLRPVPQDGIRRRTTP